MAIMRIYAEAILRAQQNLLGPGIQISYRDGTYNHARPVGGNSWNEVADTIDYNVNDYLVNKPDGANAVSLKIEVDQNDQRVAYNEWQGDRDTLIAEAKKFTDALRQQDSAQPAGQPQPMASLRKLRRI